MARKCTIAHTKTGRPKSGSTKIIEPHIFVLWGDGFDAAVATTLTMMFRRNQIATKIIGLQGRTAIGKNGIQLNADMSLGEAIAMRAKAIAFLLPCSRARLSQAENDPRLRSFFQDCQTTSTFIMVQDQNVLDQRSLSQLDIPLDHVVIYQEWSNLTHLEASVMRLALGTK